MSISQFGNAVRTNAYQVVRIVLTNAGKLRKRHNPLGECLLSLNAWGTKQRWDTIAFFDTPGVEKSKYISSNAKEFKLQDTSLDYA